MSASNVPPRDHPQSTAPSAQQLPTPPPSKRLPTPPSSKQRPPPPSSKQQPTPPSLKLSAAPLSLKQKPAPHWPKQPTPQSTKQQPTPPSSRQQPTPPSLQQQPAPPPLKRNPPPSSAPQPPPLSKQRLPPLPSLTPITNVDSLFPDAYADAPSAKQRSSVSTGQPQTLKSVVGNEFVIDQWQFTRALRLDKKHEKVEKDSPQRQFNLICGAALFLVIVFILATVGASLFGQKGGRVSTSTIFPDGRNHSSRTIVDIPLNGNDTDTILESTAEQPSRWHAEDDATSANYLYNENFAAVNDDVAGSANFTTTRQTVEFNDDA